MQWKTIDRLLFDTNFYRKVFFKQASENWILISVIPRNIFKHNAKKIYNKYDKICIWKKSVLNFSSWKEILSWMIQQKHFLICPGLHKLNFQSIYVTLAILAILHLGLLRMFLPSTHMIYRENHNSVDLFFFFQLYPIIPNMVFKFLSLTFSSHSSCYFYSNLVLSWLINLSTYFCYLHFALLSFVLLYSE